MYNIHSGMIQNGGIYDKKMYTIWYEQGSAVYGGIRGCLVH